MITFYGRKTSDNVQKAWWMLLETGQPFEHIERGGRFGGLGEPEFLKLNPHGRVPVLVDGETVVWESTAIVRYLAAEYCADTLWRLNPRQRAEVDKWMDWAQSRLYPASNRLFWLSVRTPVADQDESTISATVEDLNALMLKLEEQLKGRNYLAGDALSLADIVAGATLYRYFENPAAKPEMLNVRGWYERLKDRPAYQEAIMHPFEELRGRLAY